MSPLGWLVFPLLAVGFIALAVGMWEQARKDRES